MIEDLRGDHQLVGAGALYEGGQAPSHGLRAADHRAAQRMVHRGSLHRRQHCVDVVHRRRQLAGTARAQAGEGLLLGAGEPDSLSVGVGGDDAEAERDVGLVEVLGRPEPCAVDLQRLHQRVGREVRGEGVGQPQRGGQLGAVEAGAQDPHRNPQALAGRGAHRLAGLRRLEIGDQFQHVAWEVVHVAGERAAHSPGGQLVGARRAPDAKVDAPRMQRGQGAELLGDHQGRVVRQHDPACPYADGRGRLRRMRQRDRRRSAGDAGHVVVLRHPVAAVAPALGMARQVDRIA